MDMVDFLQRLLGGQGGPQQVGPSSLDGPNFLTQTGLGPEELARYHAMSGMGTAPHGASPAPAMAPQAPMPDQMQTASVGAPGPAGGGIGFLEGIRNLLNPEARGQAATVQWLVGKGYDPGTARAISGNKRVVQSILLDHMKDQQPKEPIEINGRLVDPNTYQVLADFSDKGDSERPIAVGEDSTLYDPNSRQWITPPKAPGSDLPDFKSTMDVRKEIQGLPSYNNYTAAVPVYNSAVETAGRNNKASDLNMIYAFAKLMDPGSVVREGEQVLVQGTGSFAEQIRGWISQAEGAGLVPELRAKLMAELKSRMDAYRGALDSDLGTYRGMIDTYKLNPEHILPQMPDVKDWEPNPSGGKVDWRFNPTTGKLERVGQ